jgi:uncharacterized lipoprotein YbaY
MKRNDFVHGIFALIVAALLAATCFADNKQVKLIKQWKGSVADEGLMADAPVYITTAENFERLWEKWKIAGKRPEVDFSKQIVVIQTSRGSNLSLIAILDEKGNLSVNGLGTMDFRPGFRYVIATVSRDGIKTINNKLITQQQGGDKRAAVTGTVTYRQRIALPPGAMVEVSLLDVSRADAPGVVIDKKEINPTTQVPIPFTLNYDPAQIDVLHSYAVQGRIMLDGKLWFTSTKRYVVITQGNPTRVQIVVDMVKSANK